MFIPPTISRNGHGMVSEISWSLGNWIPKAQLKAWMPWCSWGQRIKPVGKHRKNIKKLWKWACFIGKSSKHGKITMLIFGKSLTEPFSTALLHHGQALRVRKPPTTSYDQKYSTQEKLRTIPTSIHLRLKSGYWYVAFQSASGIQDASSKASCKVGASGASDIHTCQGEICGLQATKHRSCKCWNVLYIANIASDLDKSIYIIIYIHTFNIYIYIHTLYLNYIYIYT